MPSITVEKDLPPGDWKTRVEIITHNIAGSETVNLRCPRCGNSHRISTVELRSDIYMYKIKCKCGASHYVEFNKRKLPRKKVSLKGTCFTKNKINDEIIDILDISKKGLRFSVYGRIFMTKGQIINIRFTLDNTERESIECEAIIRWIKDGQVGVEFVNLSPTMQTRLGFYLFS